MGVFRRNSRVNDDGVCGIASFAASLWGAFGCALDREGGFVVAEVVAQDERLHVSSQAAPAHWAAWRLPRRL